MVCKEDVLLWFKDLDGYKRIDVLYELLNMCLPFELRFLGSCVEEIGRHSYPELRGSAIDANDLDKLSGDALFHKSLLDENVRHRVLIYLSLLSSRNYSVANWLYKSVLRTDWIEDYIVKGNVKDDDNLQSEFLLLFVMALHHPAFTFEQKSFFGKILSDLIEIRENTNRVSPRLSVYGYPPGFGYPAMKIANIPDGITTSIKSTAIQMPCGGDDPFHQQTVTLPNGPPPPLQADFIPWNRPGFPYGAPEIPPFPAPNVSPLVSQSATPIHSRNSSPHRTGTVRAPPSQPPLDLVQINSQLPIIDPLSPPPPPPNLPVYTNEIKILNADDELTQSIQEENQPPLTWIGPVIFPKDMKPQPNGYRCYPPYNTNKYPRPYIDQFQTLSLDGDNVTTLHRSNSSSNSSLNQTPPETPTNALGGGRAVLGGGGGGDKTLVNGGMPPPPPPTFVAATGPNPTGVLCDTTSPPPPTGFNNCTVPYTTYPAGGTFTGIPNRSMFPYTQSPYRPPFTAHYPPTYQQTNDNSYPYTTTTLPYMSIMYSSPQYPQRSPNCYNCGAGNHVGPECTRQNIEDITQKKTYNLEYVQQLPDTDK